MLRAARKARAQQIISLLSCEFKELTPCALNAPRQLSTAIASCLHCQDSPATNAYQTCSSSSPKYWNPSRTFTASVVPDPQQEAAADPQEEVAADPRQEVAAELPQETAAFGTESPSGASSDADFSFQEEGGLLSADAISDAAAAAEELSLNAAWDEAWIINRGFQYALQYIHGATGLAWWQSIALATCGARLVTLPLNLKQIQNTHRMSLARPELERLATWFKDQQAAGRGKDAQQEYMQRMAGLWRKYDCNPLKSMLPLFAQLPIFLGFFQGLRSMAAAKVPSLTVGGPALGWLGDLTIADPYGTLPLISSALLLLTVELNAVDGMQGQDPVVVQRTKNVMRAVSALMLVVTWQMPQGVFYYWITSSVLALGQSQARHGLLMLQLICWCISCKTFQDVWVLKRPAVRRLLRLPAAHGSAAGSEAEIAGMASTTAGKPVKTFATPPRKAKQAKATAKS